MKRIQRSPHQTFIYYWQRRKRGFIGIRVSHTHAWVIVGDSTNPEELLVIGPGPAIPLTPESQTQEFRDVLREVAPQHPELERLLSGDITFETAVLSS